MANISKIKTPNGTVYDLNAATVSGHTVAKDVPSTAVFTDTVPSAYCSTAAGTSAKTATCTGYVLKNPHYIFVTMANANSYNGKITLNINGKGAKNIYIDKNISSSSNKNLPAGTYIVYYDSDGYYFNTGDSIPGKVDSAGVASTAETASSAGRATYSDYATYLYQAMKVDDSGTKSVNNNVNTNCTTYQLGAADKGRYLVIASVKYPSTSSTSNAWRYTTLSTNSTTADAPISTQFTDNITMVANSQYIAHLMGIIDNSTWSSSTSIYLKAWHNLGSTQTVSYYLQVVRLTYEQS